MSSVCYVLIFQCFSVNEHALSKGLEGMADGYLPGWAGYVHPVAGCAWYSAQWKNLRTMAEVPQPLRFSFFTDGPNLWYHKISMKGSGKMIEHMRESKQCLK